MAKLEEFVPGAWPKIISFRTYNPTIHDRGLSLVRRARFAQRHEDLRVFPDVKYDRLPGELPEQSPSISLSFERDEALSCRLLSSGSHTTSRWQLNEQIRSAYLHPHFHRPASLSPSSPPLPPSSITPCSQSLITTIIITPLRNEIPVLAILMLRFFHSLITIDQSPSQRQYSLPPSYALWVLG